MVKISRKRRAEIARCARRIRQSGQRLGWSVERIAHTIMERIADVRPLEAWRFAYGWTRPQAIEGIGALYIDDGLIAPAINSSMLCRWEHGELLPGAEYGDALCRLYGVGAEELGLLTRVGQATVIGCLGCGCQAQLSASVTMCASCRRVQGRRWRTMTADSDDGAAALAAVRESIQLGLESDGPAGGASAREQLERAVEYYALNYSRFTPGLLAAEVHRCRAMVTGMLGHSQPDHARGELRRLGGWLSALLGNLAFHLADYPAAFIHLGTAERLGRDSGDAQLVCWSLGAQSMVARYQHRYDDALDLARHGLEHTTTPLTRAQLLAWAEAPALARVGVPDRSEARRVILDAGREMEADPLGEQPGRFGFDVAELELHIAEVHLVLGDPLQAGNHALASREHTTIGRPGWAAATVVLAVSEARSGHPGQAVDRAMTVLDTIPHDSLREPIRQRLAVLGHTLGTLGHPVPTYADLHERLRTLPPLIAPTRASREPNGPSAA